MGELALAFHNILVAFHTVLESSLWAGLWEGAESGVWVPGRKDPPILLSFLHATTLTTPLPVGAQVPVWLLVVFFLAPPCSCAGTRCYVALRSRVRCCAGSGSRRATPTSFTAIVMTVWVGGPHGAGMVFGVGE